MALPIVTAENYFSPGAQMAYMGHSQFLAFQRCEAAALAELTGEYVSPVTTAMLVGSYVDAWFEGTVDTFRQTHPEIFKRDGTLKAEYQQAERIIRRMESDRLYSLLMSGRKQVIRTGTIARVPFKIKIDSLLDADTCARIVREFPETGEALGMCDGAIVDQKVMKDLRSVWSEEERSRLNFVDAWGYDLEGAIYQAIEGHMLPFILAVGTKEEPTELAALCIPDHRLEARLHEVEDLAPRYQAIKEGHIQPIWCGRCDYCRSRKKLTNIFNYEEFFTC